MGLNDLKPHFITAPALSRRAPQTARTPPGAAHPAPPVWLVVVVRGMLAHLVTPGLGRGHGASLGGLISTLTSTPRLAGYVGPQESPKAPAGIFHVFTMTGSVYSVDTASAATRRPSAVSSTS